MEWYIIDNDYIEYLKQYDSKVQNINYGKNSIKPFLGVILCIGDINYCVPISSPKNKHKLMKEQLDFIKITNIDNTHIFGVINLNNMIPVKNECMNYLSYKDIDNYITFESDKQKTAYIRLLKNELRAINQKQEKIQCNAEQLRKICLDYPNSKYAHRSCDFKRLEEKCNEY